jgi:hypothetical protein
MKWSNFDDIVMDTGWGVMDFAGMLWHRLGGIILYNWYLERLSISNFSSTASIMKSWLWMIPYFIGLLVLIHQRTVYCPHHYEYLNYSGMAWWYYYLQLGWYLERLSISNFSTSTPSITIIIFYMFSGIDPSVNCLLST